MKRTRITFDFDGERRKSYDKLAQIICSSHWGSGIDIFGFINENHSLLFDLIKSGVISIYECEYELQKPIGDNENTRLIKSMLGKRNNHYVLREIAAMNHLKYQNITATQFICRTSQHF